MFDLLSALHPAYVEAMNAPVAEGGFILPEKVGGKDFLMEPSDAIRLMLDEHVGQTLFRRCH